MKIMKSPLRLISLIGGISIFLFVMSCKHDKGVAPTTVQKWVDLPMKAVMETPAPAGRNEEGDATLELMSDNSLKYDFHIHNLSPSDNLTAAHIHVGDAVTAGPVFINLNPSFTGPGASGTVTGLRAGQVDSLLHLPVYINVHSTQVPGGLVRSQLDKTIGFAMDIPLSGNNEVPAVTTTASGLAMLRLAGDTLFSLVSVTGIEATDTFTVSHIHRGAAGTNGQVKIFLASSNADFNVPRKTFLVDSLKTMLLTDPMYVNAHTKTKPGGKIRGQIR
jgi:hypothetical protein